MNPFIKRLAKEYKMTYAEVEVIFNQIVSEEGNTEDLINRLENIKLSTKMKTYNCVAYGKVLNCKSLSYGEAISYQNNCIMNYGYKPEIVEI